MNFANFDTRRLAIFLVSMFSSLLFTPFLTKLFGDGDILQKSLPYYPGSEGFVAVLSVLKPLFIVGFAISFISLALISSKKKSFLKNELMFNLMFAGISYCVVLVVENLIRSASTFIGPILFGLTRIDILELMFAVYFLAWAGLAVSYILKKHIIIKNTGVLAGIQALSIVVVLFGARIIR